MLLAACLAPFVVSTRESVAVGFLRQYHFLESDVDLFSPSSLVDVGHAVRAAQQEMGLPQTGDLDNATLALMTSPRCGVSPGFLQHAVRVRRYAVSGSRWRLAPVTVLLDRYHPDLPRSSVDEVLSGVLAAVSAVSLLRFSLVVSDSPAPDIRIRFVDADHGCVRPLGGSALAHAFPPRFGGDVHIWSAVDWNTTQLDRVLGHELLHALGLDHSVLQTALMYPYYQAVAPGTPLLSPDDVAGIQRLYSEPLPF